MFAVTSHFPLTWYGPIGLGGAAFFTFVIFYSFINGFTYGGYNPDGSWKKIFKTDNPKLFNRWICVYLFFAVLLLVYAMWAFHGAAYEAYPHFTRS